MSRKKEKQKPLSSSVFRYFLQGLVLALPLGLASWWLYRWELSISPDAVQSMLFTFIQTTGGILAIAVSFSLLYVQVSVGSYSLRAAGLLIRQKPFQQLIRDYVFALGLFTSLSLIADPMAALMPALPAALGIFAFGYSLFGLVKYIESMVTFMKPEATIHSLLEDSGFEYTYANAVDLLKGQSWRDEASGRIIHETIHVPTSVLEFSQYGSIHRILIDFARRMIDQSDHVAVKAVINAIKGAQRWPGGGFALIGILPVTEEKLTSAFSATQIEGSLLDAKIVEGAVIAYLSGALAEIWTYAFNAGDTIAAAYVMSVFKHLIRNDFGAAILRQGLFHTDFLESVLTNLVVAKAMGAEWRDLRHEALRILVEPTVERCKSVENSYESSLRRGQTGRGARIDLYRFRKTRTTEQWDELSSIQNAVLADIVLGNRRVDGNPNPARNPSPKQAKPLPAIEYWPRMDREVSVPPRYQLYKLMYYFIDMDWRLLSEATPDLALEDLVFRGFSASARLAVFAYKDPNDDGMIIDALGHIGNRLSTGKTPEWRRKLYEDKESPQLLRDLAVNWIGGEAANVYSGGARSKIEHAFDAYRGLCFQYREAGKDDQVNYPAAQAYMDALEDVAFESIRTGNQFGFELATDVMPFLADQNARSFSSAINRLLDGAEATGRSDLVSECVHSMLLYVTHERTAKDCSCVKRLQEIVESMKVDSLSPDPVHVEQQIAYLLGKIDDYLSDDEETDA